MEKTKYRKKYDEYGIFEYLQYEKEIPFLIFWKRKVWSYIWKPYYHRTYGRSTSSLSDLVIAHNLDNFIKEYPNVEDWFEKATIEQEKLIDDVRKKQEEYDQNKNKITEIHE